MQRTLAIPLNYLTQHTANKPLVFQFSLNGPGFALHSVLTPELLWKHRTGFSQVFFFFASMILKTLVILRLMSLMQVMRRLFPGQAGGLCCAHHDSIMDESTAVPGRPQVWVFLCARYLDAPNRFPCLVQLCVDRINPRMMGGYSIAQVCGNPMFLEAEYTAW